MDFSLSTSSFSRSERTSRSSASLRTPAALAFARASSHAASLAASAAVASSSCLRRAEASRAVSREAPAKLRAVRRETSVAAVPGRLPGSNPPSFKSASGKSPKGPFVANREAVDVTDATPSSYNSSRSRRRCTLCRSVAISRARPRHPPAASSDFSSLLKSTLSSPTSRLMMARRRSFSARTVWYLPASRSARALASRAFSFHSARSLDASSAAFAASATTSRHAFSICDSVRGVPSSFETPACKTPGARPAVPARAALSSVTSRAFSAFSFSTAKVSERFFRAISTIFDSRTPAASRSPPVSSAALSSAHSRSFASSACTSSWLRRVSSWTCESWWKGGVRCRGDVESWGEDCRNRARPARVEAGRAARLTR